MKLNSRDKIKAQIYGLSLNNLRVCFPCSPLIFPSQHVLHVLSALHTCYRSKANKHQCPDPIEHLQSSVSPAPSQQLSPLTLLIPHHVYANAT